MSDPTYMRSLQQFNPQRQKVGAGCQGLGEGAAELVFNDSVWEDEVLELTVVTAAQK